MGRSEGNLVWVGVEGNYLGIIEHSPFSSPGSGEGEFLGANLEDRRGGTGVGSCCEIVLGVETWSLELIGRKNFLFLRVRPP